jgi:predicted AAA+ superfamily ATPase
MAISDAFVFWNPWWANEKGWMKAHGRDAIQFLKQLLRRKEILTISGVKRSGKTTVIYLLIDALLKAGVNPKNILYLNLEDPAFKDLSIFNLYGEYLEFINPSGKIYIFLDEVQEIDGWQRDLRKLYDGIKNLKIVITGSNSSLLKDEYATLLTGRTILYEIYPFSFGEAVRLRGILTDFDLPTIIRKKTQIKHLLREYIEYGGFPEVLNEEDKKLKLVLLKEYYNGILARDVIRRHSIRQTAKYEKAAHYLMSNITSLFSVKNLSGLLGINMHTLEDYIGFLEDVYLFFGVNHLSYSLKRQITYPRKAYCIDNGFINAVSFRFSDDTGKLLENLIFTEIKRQGLECYYWKGKQECDFVLKDGKTIREVLQVTYSMRDLRTKKREIEGILEAMREFKLKKGTILAYDESDSIDIEGKIIEIVPIWQWLLRPVER